MLKNYIYKPPTGINFKKHKYCQWEVEDLVQQIKHQQNKFLNQRKLFNKNLHLMLINLRLSNKINKRAIFSNY